MTETNEIIIIGSIQGVGFRPFIYRIANSNNITGFVQNNGNFVKILAQGTSSNLDSFYQDILDKKPPLAFIEGMNKKFVNEPQIFTEFKIIKSSSDSSIKTTSYIPADTAICNNCLNDMTIGDRSERKNYPFTSCVDCGPRYSIIRSLPYDRPFTTMDDFPLCNKCSIEYTDPLNRRFHAQTTCCTTCGPEYTLLDRNGRVIEKDIESVIKKCQDLLANGKILAIKGIGGTHLACRPDEESIINRLRMSKGDRLRKPFALMSYSLDEIKNYAEINSKEIEQVLTSPRRPIVLLKKQNPFRLATNLAPNLHNIGFMLPYSGFHYLLLHNDTTKTLVMTSANKSHLPIEIANEEILESMNDIADYFVLHNRIIHQRIDDSVIKPIQIDSSGLYSLFIRRSRGFTPEPINFPLFTSEDLLIGLGSELHTSPALLTQGKLFFTQYIGNLRYEKTFKFFKNSIQHIMNLLQRSTLQGVAHDLHPLYLSTEYAMELKNQYNIPELAFQHHYSHAASLLVDNELWDSQAVIVTADGLGLGTDNAIWGGEILSCDLNQYTRLDHLHYVHQPGGDTATKHPVRMLISYLYANDWSETEILNYFEGLDNNFVHNLIGQIKNNINSPLTSSTGRFLDTCSNLLGFCNEETYEGEPAIVLEGAGWNAIHATESNPIITFAEKNDLGLNFIPIIPFIIELLKKNISRNKLAFFLQDFVGWAYATRAHNLAVLEGITNIGFTGGVAFNEIIMQSFAKILKKEDEKVNILFHKKISPGDQGIAGGQVALFSQTNK